MKKEIKMKKVLSLVLVSCSHFRLPPARSSRKTNRPLRPYLALRLAFG
jgi:hypothetical protein